MPVVIISLSLLALFLLTGCAGSDGANSANPTVIDFYSDLCMPCQQMDPILESVEEEFRDSVTVRRVDVNQEPDLANEYRVVYIPTYVFLDADGNESERSVGLLTEQELRDKFEKLVAGQ